MINFLLVYELLISLFNLQTDKLRCENREDMSIAQAITIVLERCPDLRFHQLDANSYPFELSQL